MSFQMLPSHHLLGVERRLVPCTFYIKLGEGYSCGFVRNILYRQISVCYASNFVYFKIQELNKKKVVCLACENPPSDKNKQFHLVALSLNSF